MGKDDVPIGQNLEQLVRSNWVDARHLVERRDGRPLPGKFQMITRQSADMPARAFESPARAGSPGVSVIVRCQRLKGCRGR